MPIKYKITQQIKIDNTNVTIILVIRTWKICMFNIAVMRGYILIMKRRLTNIHILDGKVQTDGHDLLYTNYVYTRAQLQVLAYVYTYEHVDCFALQPNVGKMKTFKN